MGKTEKLAKWKLIGKAKGKLIGKAKAKLIGKVEGKLTGEAKDGNLDIEVFISTWYFISSIAFVRFFSFAFGIFFRFYSNVMSFVLPFGFTYLF